MPPTPSPQWKLLPPQADSPEIVQLGHALAMQAYLAVQASDIDEARRILVRARDIVTATGDADLSVRVELIGHYCAILHGDGDARQRLLAVLASAPRHIGETHSSGYTNLTYFDVEQRRLGPAEDLLGKSIPLMVEHDLPICRMVQLGSRSRWALLVGDWDTALTDADVVLTSPSAPLARVWPLLIRGIVTLRRTGADTGDIDEAWELACRFGEMIRMLPAACALAERTWLTGVPDARLDRCSTLLASAPASGLEWARGELAAWSHRLGAHLPGVAGVAEPYALVLDGRFDAAADAFERVPTPFDAALALLDAGVAAATRRALDIFDRLGADAVAAKVRSDLRAAGAAAIPGPRRTTTLGNPAGLTNRQVDVLRLLADGLTNAELADRLFLSVKTVDHHVSAILTKLDVTKRRDAVRRARETGILT